MKATVIVINGVKASKVEIEPDGLGLRDVQKIVGGWIEAVSLPDGLTLWCNEDGRMQGLTPHATPFPSCPVICGTYVVSRTTPENGDFASVTEDDFNLISHQLFQRGMLS